MYANIRAQTCDERLRFAVNLVHHVCTGEKFKSLLFSPIKATSCSAAVLEFIVLAAALFHGAFGRGKRLGFFHPLLQRAPKRKI